MDNSNSAANKPNYGLYFGDIGKSRRRQRVQQKRGQKPHAKSQLPMAVVEMVDDTGPIATFENYDLSHMGVYLYSDILFSEGDQVELRLSLPSYSEPIYVCGEVDHATAGKKGAMGITFKNLGTYHELLLRQFVARRTHSPDR